MYRITLECFSKWGKDLFSNPSGTREPLIACWPTQAIIWDMLMKEPENTERKRKPLTNEEYTASLMSYLHFHEDPLFSLIIAQQNRAARDLEKLFCYSSCSFHHLCKGWQLSLWYSQLFSFFPLGHRHSCHHYLISVLILSWFVLWIVFYTVHGPNPHILLHNFFSKHILTIFFIKSSVSTRTPRTN